MGAKPKPARVPGAPEADNPARGKPPKSATLAPPENGDHARTERLHEALYRISDCANSVDDLQQLYQALHKIIGELIYAKNLYISLLDESAKELHFPYFVDENDPAPNPRKLGKGLTEYVLRTGKSLLANLSQQVYQMARAQGLNKEDGSAIIKLFEKLAGVTVSGGEKSP